MNRKVYKCQFYGGMVEILNPTGGGLSCCGAPLTFTGESCRPATREAPAPLIDLIEVVANGKSFWQFPAAGEAAQATAR
jgi:desulfoferrodoxin-like iron-binding protein